MPRLPTSGYQGTGYGTVAAERLGDEQVDVLVYDDT